LKLFDFKKDIEKPKEAQVSGYKEEDFDLSTLESTRLGDAFFSLLGGSLRRVVFPLMHRFKPVVNLGSFTLVARYEDVQTILESPQSFNVPFGPDMLAMTGGPVFALGDDGAEHDLQMEIAREAWDQAWILETAQSTIDKIVPALLKDSGGDIDAATDVLMRGLAEACIASFGLNVPDADKFAAYATACSVQLFANPTNGQKPQELASVGAKHLRNIIDASIDRYRADLATGSTDIDQRSLLASLMRAQADTEPEEQKARTRALLFGFVTGFVPTLSLAAGKILEYLRKNPALFSEAVSLARHAGSDIGNKEFTDFLMEAARQNPALFPGQGRRRKTGLHDRPLPRHLRSIPENNYVFACTAAALHDANVMANPRRFDAKRGYLDHSGQPVENFLFGHGIHHCVGAELSKALLPILLGHLLTRPGIQFSAKQPRFFSAYLGELRMTFEVDSGHRSQSMLNAILPLRPTSDPDGLLTLLESMNAAESPTMQMLQETGIVHFASLTAINLGEGGNLDGRQTDLLIELNLDGDQQTGLERLRTREGEAFKALLEHIDTSSSSFFAAVEGAILQPKTRPWGTIGVNFPGTSDMSVAQIAAEQKLYKEAQAAIEDVRRHKGYSDGRHEDVTDVFSTVRSKMEQDAEFGWMLHRPSDRYPAFARHEESGYYTFLLKYIFPRRRIFVIAAYVLFTLTTALIVGVKWGWSAADQTYFWIWYVPLFLSLAVAAGSIWLLRRKEQEEKPDDRIAPHEYVQNIQSQENRPGHVQNHITSVSTLKPGFFRKITTALAFHLIQNMVLQWFRPGFVTDFATIHYARWVRPKGYDKLIFQSNYDGSWESYLEDFITKVHAGQTMAWNNCVGFPKTNWFAEDGAEDGDAFKRWVRLQQVPVQFWYSRFPELTTGMIRTNAQVRDGLARAKTYDEHRAWLSLFESVPAPEAALETTQVQTLLFRGLGRHNLMKARLLHFGEPDLARAWLRQLVQEAYIADSPTTPAPGRLSFGDSYPNGAPAFIALSSSGLKHLGMPDQPFDGIPTLPHAFVGGMGQRQEILGDRPSAGGSPAWRWTDAEAPKSKAVTAHALLLCYTREVGTMTDADEYIERALEQAGISILEAISSDRRRDDGKKEMAFGFEDGISQPIMRGTQVHAKERASTDDVVSPGEFILGYPDSRGYLPPPLTVSATSPAASCLPSVEPVVQGLVPRFGKRSHGLMDFGRNGSFLVVRQFLHNENAFKSFIEKQSAPSGERKSDRSNDPALPRDADDNIATTDRGKRKHKEQWVAAKMFGRWQDGSSLTRNPSLSATSRRRVQFHKNVAEALHRIALSDLDQAGNAQSQLARFAPPGSRLSEEDSLHIDWAVWADDDWERFLKNYRSIEETLGLRLFVQKSLLKKIKPDNDFRHGSDDPQGLNCPFGSHIRRANPRDSFRPGSEVTLEINNRHRLLRRGRTFTTERLDAVSQDQLKSGWAHQDAQGNTHEEGTFFMCFNANIERQFEFVQQTWIDSRVFHGGREGPDPIVSPKRAGDRFVIPGASNGAFLDCFDNPNDEGAWDFVQVVAGGYFFMPSRQALEYLSRL